MSGVPSTNSLPHKTSTAAQQSTTVNIPMLTANTEYSYTLPQGCNRFSLKLRGTSATLKMFIGDSSQTGLSGTTYMTIPANTIYYENDINSVYGTTLFVQANEAAQVAELILWNNLTD